MPGGFPLPGPLRQANSLLVNKQIFDRWDFHLQWHDMFYSKLSALLAGVAWRF